MREPHTSKNQPYSPNKSEPYSSELYDNLNALDDEICATASRILAERPNRNMPEFSNLLRNIIDIHGRLENLKFTKELLEREEVVS